MKNLQIGALEECKIETGPETRFSFGNLVIIATAPIASEFERMTRKAGIFVLRPDEFRPAESGDYMKVLHGQLEEWAGIVWSKRIPMAVNWRHNRIMRPTRKARRRMQRRWH